MTRGTVALLGVLVACGGGEGEAPSGELEPPPPPPARLPEGAQLETLAQIPGVIHDLEVDATHVYVSTNAGSAETFLFRVAREGGELEQLWDGASINPDIELDETHIYLSGWGQSAYGDIMRVPKQGGPATVVSDAVDSPGPLVLDGDHVYCVNPGALLRVPKHGGPPVTLATGLDYPSDPVISGDRIVFVEQNQWRVLAVPRAGGEPQVLARDYSAFAVASHGQILVFAAYANDGGQLPELFAISGGAVLPIFPIPVDRQPGRIVAGPGYLFWGGFWYSTVDGTIVDLFQPRPGLVSTTAAGDERGLYVGDLSTNQILTVALEPVTSI